MRTLALFLASGVFLAHASSGVYEKVKGILQSESSKEQKESRRLGEEIERRLDMKVSVNVKDVSLEYLFFVLSNQVKLPIIFYNYESGEDKSLGKVTYYAEGKPFRYVLEELSGLFDLSFSVQRGRVLVYRYVEKTFQLRLPALMKEINQDEKFFKASYKKELLNRLEESLKALLKDSKSKVSVNEMGYVVVRGRPSEVALIGRVVEDINRYWTMEIPLKVKVIVTRLNNTREGGLNLLEITRLDALGRGVTATMNLGGLGGLTIGVITSNVEAFIRMLETMGDTRVVEEYVIRGLNYQPIVFAPVTKQKIISNIKTGFVSGGEGAAAIPTVTTETEEVETGALTVLVPYVLSERDDTVVIDMVRSQKEVLELREQTIRMPGGEENTLVLPRVNSLVHNNQIILRRGESLVVFSAVLTREEISKRGIPFLVNIPVIGVLFGEHKKGRDRFLVTVVLSYERDLTSQISER